MSERLQHVVMTPKNKLAIKELGTQFGLGVGNTYNDVITEMLRIVKQSAGNNRKEN